MLVYIYQADEKGTTGETAECSQTTPAVYENVGEEHSTASDVIIFLFIFVEYRMPICQPRLLCLSTYVDSWILCRLMDVHRYICYSSVLTEET